MKKATIVDIVALWLKERSFEELLEQFDLTPEEVFVELYENGLIDEEILVGINDTYEY